MAIDIVGSKMPADNSYGQNGYTGASSDLPGQKTTSGFLPQPDPAVYAPQTRNLADSNVPDHPHMQGAAKGLTIGPEPVRPPVTK